MVKGPCLCGDVYCPSCGDPSAARMEEAEQRLCNVLADMNADEEVYYILAIIAPKAQELITKAREEKNGKRHYS